MTARSRRLDARARMWLSVDNLRVIGPLHGITAGGLRDALVRLHAAHPGLAAVCRLDRAAARWVPLCAAEFAAFSGRLVVPAGATADAVTHVLIDEPLGDRPLLLAVGGAFVGAKIAHAVGDGRIVNTLFPEIVAASAAGRTPRPPFPAPVRLPLVRALLHHFGRHPARLVAAGGISRPPAGAGAAEPWQPDVRYRSARSAHALAAVRGWRDRYAPGLSAAAVLFAAAPAALTRAGLPPKWPGAVVLVDARRYLPAGGTVDGNFSWGQYLRPADLTDPRAVHAALAAELATGRPLAMLALRTARLALRPDRPATASRVSARPQPELTLTHIGRLDGYLDVPWAGPPEEHRNISVPTTSGPEAVTVSFSELAGALYVNVSFHGSTFDPGRIATAVELLCRDPVGLVSAAAG